MAGENIQDQENVFLVWSVDYSTTALQHVLGLLTCMLLPFSTSQWPAWALRSAFALCSTVCVAAFMQVNRSDFLLSAKLLEFYIQVKPAEIIKSQLFAYFLNIMPL